MLRETFWKIYQITLFFQGASLSLSLQYIIHSGLLKVITLLREVSSFVSLIQGKGKHIPKLLFSLSSPIRLQMIQQKIFVPSSKYQSEENVFQVIIYFHSFFIDWKQIFAIWATLKIIVWSNPCQFVFELFFESSLFSSSFTSPLVSLTLCLSGCGG